MTNNPQKFDANQYKQTTREQWNSAAEAWHRWNPLLSRWLGPATETMLDTLRCQLWQSSTGCCCGCRRAVSSAARTSG